VYSVALNDATVRQYLLGQAADFEQHQIEDALLLDDDARRQIAIVEDELIDEYLAGELTSDERSRFESHFLAHESRRRNLRFSQALHLYIKEHPEAAPVRARKGGSMLWLRFAAVAAAVAIGVAVWIGYSQRSRLNDSATNQPARTGSAIAPTPVPPVVLTLSPGLLRSGGQETVLKTRPAGPSIEVHLELPQEASGFAGYSAKLATVEGNEVWRQTGLRREGNHIQLSIPTSLLSRGDWRVALAGISPQGRTSEVSSYYFRVLFD
jgi:hypothetical protein